MNIGTKIVQGLIGKMEKIIQEEMEIIALTETKKLHKIIKGRSNWWKWCWECPEQTELEMKK